MSIYALTGHLNDLDVSIDKQSTTRRTIEVQSSTGRKVMCPVMDCYDLRYQFQIRPAT